MSPFVSTVVILALMGLVVLIFRRMIRPPVGVGQDDPPGVRSVAIFAGDDPEFFADDHDDRPLVGVRLFGMLCDGFAAAGLDVVHRGTVQNAQAAELIVDGQRLGVVLERVEQHWVASVEWAPQTPAEKRHVALTQQVFAPQDGPGVRRLLATLDGWLKSQPSISGVAWHRKERWLTEDFSSPSATPLNELS